MKVPGGWASSWASWGKPRQNVATEGPGDRAFSFLAIEWFVLSHPCDEKQRRRKDGAPGTRHSRNLMRTDRPIQKQILRFAEESRSTQDDTSSTLKPAASAGGDFAFTQEDTASTLEPDRISGPGLRR